MIIGQRYGKLVVIEYRPARKKDVLCKCNCGKEVERILEHLEESKSRGVASMCRDCSLRLRSARSKMRHNHFVRSFKQTGSLYTLASIGELDLPISYTEENISPSAVDVSPTKASSGTTLMSRKEIGKALGISKERVRQIENRALEKLRNYLLPKLAD